MKPPVLPMAHTEPRRDALRCALAWSLAFAAADAGAQSVPKPGSYTETRWEELVPKGWDPMKGMRDRNVGALNDSDPKVMDMLRQMREAWDNAPAEPTLEGRAIKLPGYLVPLDESKSGITEFLLVPYFGACIHTPPPPANQIVLVRPAKPVTGYRSMDTVWVSGTMRTARQESPMGASAYRIEAALVDRYTAAAR